MRPMNCHNRSISYPEWRRLPVVTSRIRKLFLTIPLLIFFAFLSVFLQIAVAASTSPEAPKIQNPNVTFETGCLSVQAKGVKLKALMEAIRKDFPR